KQGVAHPIHLYIYVLIPYGLFPCSPNHSRIEDEGRRSRRARKDRTRGNRKGILEEEMALKFLNKKGWHTGSLRNIENVWKAEQKHEAEQRKLEELRKQIQDEREKSEFRLLQEQAGLVP
ncbi:hypothetical protein BHE74_00013360, partial [Ensete ventricosum]